MAPPDASGVSHGITRGATKWLPLMVGYEGGLASAGHSRGSQSLLEGSEAVGFWGTTEWLQHCREAEAFIQNYFYESNSERKTKLMVIRWKQQTNL